VAMRLKRDFNLVAVKATLLTRADAAAIRIELELTEDHEPHTVWDDTIPAEVFGLLSQRQDRGSDAGVDQFRLPDRIVDGIGATLDDVGYDGPVWLHLVKPYGVLGAVPWERLLAPMRRPLLRLPDALADRPAELPRTLDVILCASRPVSEQAFNIPFVLAGIAERIVESAQGRQVRVNVFADLECLRELRDRLSATGLLDRQVILWDPHASPDYRDAWRRQRERSSTGAVSISSPWLLWMLDSMRGRAVDLVHFVCHGFLAENSGALAFAESPVQNDDPQWCRFVGGGELSRLLLHLGAWSVGFTSPAGNYSEMGLRLLADEFAQVRPGPVFHHDCDADASFEQIAEAYRLLYGTHPDPVRQMPAIALCCQPATLARADAADAVPAVGAALREAAIPEVPGWLASAHRFVEQKEFEIERIKRNSPRPTSRQAENVEGMSRGVDEIRQALDRLVKKGVL
jgi:hypothetical protein